VIGRRHGSLWLIGCGNMAGAMLRRWLATGLDPARVTVIRPSGAPAADRVRVLTAIPDEPAPDIVLLGVKPQKLHEVASPLAAAVGSETMLLSILAGVEQATLRGLFPRVGAIIRVMPNTPVAVGKGAVALFTTEARPDERHQAASLMAPLGLVEWIDDEQLFARPAGRPGAAPRRRHRRGRGGARIGVGPHAPRARRTGGEPGWHDAGGTERPRRGGRPASSHGVDAGGCGAPQPRPG
jgi:pyrroline-5-carboxylate reductase